VSFRVRLSLPSSQCFRPGSGLFVLILIAAACCQARAQAFVVTGGSSSTSHAHGGSVEFRTERRIGRLDLGVFGKPSLGFSVRQTVRGHLVSLGDQQLSLATPTDVSGTSHYFLGRGVSILRKNGAGQSLLFAGAVSNGLQAPFLKVSRAESGALAFLSERRLSPSTRWVSRNLLSRRQTSIQSLEWSREKLKLALSGGFGSNQPYWASALAFNQGWITVDAGYTKSGEAFRRVVVSTPQFSENDRESIRVQLAPLPNLRIVASRHHYLAPEQSGLSGRATVNGFGFWTSIAGTQFHGSLFQSSTASVRSRAVALGTRRAFNRRIEASFDVLSNGRPFSKNSTFVATVRETLNTRLTLNQVITRSSGQTAISYGGSLLSNLVSVTAEYQTVFLPFVSAGPQQFKQVLVLGLHFQLPRGIQIRGDTSVGPTGKVRYTSYATSYGYREMSASPGASSSGGFFRYLVRGRVVHAEGQPLEGAAVMIGGELAFTNSQGDFYLRLRQDREVPFAVALAEFVTPGRYEVVSAPSSVLPARDGEESQYEIVVRRLPNAPNASQADPFEE
jgi:hypothetical protein